MAKHRFMRPDVARKLARLYSYRKYPDLTREQRNAFMFGLHFDLVLEMARAEIRARDESARTLPGLGPPGIKTRPEE
jgi:hypothetical protein